MLPVPLGLCAALALARHRWLVVPAAALASATIETIQLVASPARYATVRDVVANTTGALIGYLLALATLAYLRRRARARSSVQQPPLSAPIGTVFRHSTAAHPTAAHPTKPWTPHRPLDARQGRRGPADPYQTGGDHLNGSSVCPIRSATEFRIRGRPERVLGDGLHGRDAGHHQHRR